MDEREQELERSVRRWRLVSFCLAFLLICALAIGGTTVCLVLVGSPDQEGFMMPWTRQRIMRDRAMLERLEAVRQVEVAEKAEGAAKAAAPEDRGKQEP